MKPIEQRIESFKKDFNEGLNKAFVTGILKAVDGKGIYQDEKCNQYILVDGKLQLK